MNKSLKLFLYAAMLSAILMMAVCAVNYIELGTQLRSTDARLAESRNSWQNIAAEKEALQDELEAKQSDLKEADKTLNESTERAEAIRAEIEALHQEIDLLKSATD